MRRRQSTGDHQKRLSLGRCPVHAVAMTQIEYREFPEQGLPYSVVGCPRPGCAVTATTHRPWGPWELTPEFAYLVEENVP